MLSRDEIKRIYDRVGVGQDRGASYEDVAINDLCVHAHFEAARHVFEFGCGTGRVAADLLAHQLPSDATYHAVDLSSTMVQLAQARLAPWSKRTLVARAVGSPHVPLASGSVDRFISMYVLDIFSAGDIQAILAEAHRVLTHEGRLCLASLTYGKTFYGRIRSSLWLSLYKAWPALVGGCRPVRLRDFLDGAWQVEHQAVVMKRGISSEVVVARPR